MNAMKNKIVSRTLKRFLNFLCFYKEIYFNKLCMFFYNDISCTVNNLCDRNTFSVPHNPILRHSSLSLAYRIWSYDSSFSLFQAQGMVYRSEVWAAYYRNDKTPYNLRHSWVHYKAILVPKKTNHHLWVLVVSSYILYSNVRDSCNT